MFWSYRKPSWPIDPLRVALGSVVDDSSLSLSRSHVRVKYHRQTRAQFMALGTFMQRCREDVRGGRALDIEHLLVAPIVKQRYPRFFDSLTDWGPARRRACSVPES
jgi:hypothetical protein